MKTKIVYIMAVSLVFSVGFGITTHLKVEAMSQLDTGQSSYLYTGIMTIAGKDGKFDTMQIRRARLKDGTLVRTSENLEMGIQNREIVNLNDGSGIVVNDLTRKFCKFYNPSPRPGHIRPKLDSCAKASAGVPCTARTIMPELGIEVQQFTHIVEPPNCKKCPPDSKMRVDMWVAPLIGYVTVKQVTSRDNKVTYRIDPISLEVGGDYEEIRKYDGYQEVPYPPF